MLILINSSKTMQRADVAQNGNQPIFISNAQKLHAKLARKKQPAIMRGMHVSKQLADSVMSDIASWQPVGTTRALYAFQGDIYQGLRAETFSADDEVFADTHLRILSGLYGILRPCDVIEPYRLEVGYGFPVNLYKFWDNAIAMRCDSKIIINLASAEYAKAVIPHLSADTQVIEPQFFVQYPGEQPKFAAYHAKIARGAFAAWLIKTKNTTGDAFANFTELGYVYSMVLSTPNKPAFVLKTIKK